MTFSGETAGGWQHALFTTPVAITANTIYVASYYAPNGNYAANSNFFSAAGIDRPPLHPLRDGVSGGNGVYAYGGGTTFPTNSWLASNYWVDVVFTAATVRQHAAGRDAPVAGLTAQRECRSRRPSRLPSARQWTR